MAEFRKWVPTKLWSSITAHFIPLDHYSYTKDRFSYPGMEKPTLCLARLASIPSSGSHPYSRRSWSVSSYLASLVRKNRRLLLQKVKKGPTSKKQASIGIRF